MQSTLDLGYLNDKDEFKICFPRYGDVLPCIFSIHISATILFSRGCLRDHTYYFANVNSLSHFCYLSLREWQYPFMENGRRGIKRNNE